MIAWVNGRLVPAEVAAVSVVDHGFTVGDGIFETLKLVDGEPFALTRHLRRLTASATRMGLTPPDDEAVRAAIRGVVDANPEAATGVARLRITYTAGPGPLGSERNPAESTLVAVAAPTPPWAATTSIITVPWPRNERGALAGVKSTSYAENVIALARAREAGASEAVLANTAGRLCEGTGSNVFVVVAGEVLTPPLSSGCLAGITRDLVLEWCGGIERDMPLDVLATAEEIFLTSSTRDVHPVARMDDRELLAPGPVTEECARIFRERAALAMDP